MPDQEREHVRLQVAGADERDVGKGTARLDHGVMDALKIQEGDVVEIVGERATAAIALPPYPQDEGLRLIRLDGLLRANANVGIGTFVEVRAAVVQSAERVSLAPAQKNLRLMGSGQALLRTCITARCRATLRTIAPRNKGIRDTGARGGLPARRRAPEAGRSPHDPSSRLHGGWGMSSVARFSFSSRIKASHALEATGNEK